jgi:hypothetical protein
MATITVVQHSIGVVGDETAIAETPEQEATREEDEINFLVRDKVYAKALFIHENRIRALEGKPPGTRSQFIIFLKSLA